VCAEWHALVVGSVGVCVFVRGNVCICFVVLIQQKCAPRSGSGHNNHALTPHHCRSVMLETANAWREVAAAREEQGAPASKVSNL